MGKHKDIVRMKWSEDCIKHFLEACIHEVTTVGRNEGSLHRCSWSNVRTHLQDVCNLKVSQKQVRNEYDYLKWKFFAWAYLKQHMADRYDPETNTFNLTNEEWDDFLRDHPKAKTLRSSPLAFPDLCAVLYERAFTIGEIRWTPSSKVPSSKLSKSFVSPISAVTPNFHVVKIKGYPRDSQKDGTQLMPSRLTMSKSQKCTHPSTPISRNVRRLKTEYILPDNSQEAGIQIPATLESPKAPAPLLEIEYFRDNDQECESQNPSAQCSESTTSVPMANIERPSAMKPNSNEERPKRKGKTLTDERPKKKGKAAMKFTRLEDLSNALKVFAKSHAGPSQEECVDKLNRLGWEKNSSSYVAALGIFCEGAGYREGWMLLPVDNVELIQLWVASVGKKLGYI